MLVARGRRKEGASGENGGAGVLWCWPAAELWVVQPAALAHGEACTGCLAVANCYAASPQDAVDRFPSVRAVEVKGKPYFVDFGLVPLGWGTAAAPWVAAADGIP